MTTRTSALAALVVASAAVAANPALASAVEGWRGPAGGVQLRAAPLVLPGPVSPQPTPHVAAADLSRGLFDADPEAALDALSTVTLSRDGSTGIVPATPALRAILESLMQGYQPK